MCGEEGLSTKSLPIAAAAYAEQSREGSPPLHPLPQVLGEELPLGTGALLYLSLVLLGVGGEEGEVAFCLLGVTWGEIPNSGGWEVTGPCKYIFFCLN